jgi:hypothetical protein
MNKSKLLALFCITKLASLSNSPAAEAKPWPPNLNLIVQSLERAEQQNPARLRPHEISREYKGFRADDTRPTCEVTARVSFTPPNRKTFTITHASGNPRIERIVLALLEQETEAATQIKNRDISRANYDFVFLRQENFGIMPEYVLHIIPKRKEKGLILGQIWVDEKTSRIRRIQGVPAKSPSIWISDSYLTLQFADVNGMWLSVSLDAIATVRLLGRYTLTGLYVGSRKPGIPAQ